MGTALLGEINNAAIFFVKRIFLQPAIWVSRNAIFYLRCGGKGTLALEQ